MTEMQAAPADPAKVDAANAAAGDAILEYIKSQNLSATGLTVTFDGASGTASVFGVAPTTRRPRRRSSSAAATWPGWARSKT